MSQLLGRIMRRHLQLLSLLCSERHCLWPQLVSYWCMAALVRFFSSCAPSCSCSKSQGHLDSGHCCALQSCNLKEFSPILTSHLAGPYPRRTYWFGLNLHFLKFSILNPHDVLFEESSEEILALWCWSEVQPEYKISWVQLGTSSWSNFKFIVRSQCHAHVPALGDRLWNSSETGSEATDDLENKTKS